MKPRQSSRQLFAAGRIPARRSTLGVQGRCSCGDREGVRRLGEAVPTCQRCRDNGRTGGAA